MPIHQIMDINSTGFLTNFSCLVDVSDDSLSELAWLVSDPTDPDFDTAGNGYATSAFIMLLFLLGLPWNLFVICAIVKKRLCSQPIIMLMLNLSITNLLVCILVMPFNIVSGIAGEYVFGESDLVRCRVCQIGVAVTTLPWISIHTLCLMSVDRFIYLKRPLTYTRIVTPKRMFAAIIAIWVLCIAISIPPLFGFGEIRFAFRIANCAISLVGSTSIGPNYYYPLLLLAEGLVPIITLFAMYAWILCIVRSALVQKWKKSDSNSDNTTENDKKHCKDQLHLVRFFSTVFTANMVTWLPFIILFLLIGTVGAARIPPPIFTITYLSYLSETVIHPVFEALHIREIQVTVCEVPKSLCWKCDLCGFKKNPKQNHPSAVTTSSIADVV